MLLYIFNCSNRNTRFGWTADINGNNLPNTECQRGNWIFRNSKEINKGDKGQIGTPPSDVILSAIEKDGFYISDVMIKTTEKVLKRK